MLEVEDSRNCRPSCRPILTMVLRRQGMWSPVGLSAESGIIHPFSRDTSTTYIWGSKLGTSIIHCLLKSTHAHLGLKVPTGVFDILWYLLIFIIGFSSFELRVASLKKFERPTQQPNLCGKVLKTTWEKKGLWAQNQRIPHTKSSFWTAYLPLFTHIALQNHPLISSIYHPFIQYYTVQYTTHNLGTSMDGGYEKAHRGISWSLSTSPGFRALNNRPKIRPTPVGGMLVPCRLRWKWTDINWDFSGF